VLLLAYFFTIRTIQFNSNEMHDSINLDKTRLVAPGIEKGKFARDAAVVRPQGRSPVRANPARSFPSTGPNQILDIGDGNSIGDDLEVSEVTELETVFQTMQGTLQAQESKLQAKQAALEQTEAELQTTKVALTKAATVARPSTFS
jgi:hypothetical protein